MFTIHELHHAGVELLTRGHTLSHNYAYIHVHAYKGGVMIRHAHAHLIMNVH